MNAEHLNPAASDTLANPHVLWRQLLSLVFFTVLLTYFLGGVMGVIVGLLLSGTTFADAWVSGIYKDPNKKSFLNLSPMAWGVAMVGLFIVAYPAYILSRNKLRTRQAGNGLFIAVVVIGALLVALLLWFAPWISAGAV